MAQIHGFNLPLEFSLVKGYVLCYWQGMKARILINFFLFLVFSKLAMENPDKVILKFVAGGLFGLTAFWTWRFIHEAFRVIQRKD